MSRKRHVVAYGEALWDFFAVGTAAPGIAVYERHAGGSSVNLAVALSALGVEADVAAVVGDDPLGDALVEALVGRGIGVRRVERRRGRTSFTLVERDGAGEPTFTNVRDPAVDRPVQCRSFAGASAVVVATEAAFRPGYGVSPSSPGHWAAAFNRLAKLAARRRLPLVLDVNARPRLWSSQAAARRALAQRLPSFALVKASHLDLARLDPNGDADRGAAWLRRHQRAGAALVITRGASPATLYLERCEATIPTTPAARVVDASGAGDAFLAGLLADLIRSRRLGEARWSAGDLVRAVERGHTVAARVLAQVGASLALPSALAVNAPAQDDPDR